MDNTKTLVIKRETILSITYFIILLAIATFAPFLKSQTITGPIVNATLFISVLILGAENAILVGLVPSLVALSVGFLPAAISPMIPFIMAGNAILVVVFNFFRRKNYWLGVILASVLKFLFLWSSSSIVINLLLKKEIAQKAAAMMSWPQLLTALAGGVIAYLILKGIKK